jgi:hypothetical protein
MCSDAPQYLTRVVLPLLTTFALCHLLCVSYMIARR